MSELALTFENAHGSFQIERHSPTSHVAGLRLHVKPESRGQGHGKRLARLAVEVAPELGIRRLEATPYVCNPASTALFDGLEEFQWEGVRRLGGRIDGRLVDTHLYAWVAEREIPTEQLEADYRLAEQEDDRDRMIRIEEELWRREEEGAAP